MLHGPQYGDAYLNRSPVSVGTPPQKQYVLLDTGSSDLYLVSTSFAACDDCPGVNLGGTFTPSNSQTYVEVAAGLAFNKSLTDGTVTGPFGQDTVCIGDVCIENVQFGVAQEVSSTTARISGVLGVGYSLEEATSTSSQRYPDLLDVLRYAGVIDSRLFSVYPASSLSYGNVLFGGIDSSRCEGELVTLDFLENTQTQKVDKYIQVITASTITVNGSDRVLFSGGSPNETAYSSSDPGMPVLLNTGVSEWTVDPAFWDKHLAPLFNVDDQGNCPCQACFDGDISISLQLGAAVTLTLQDLNVSVYDSSDTPLQYPNSNDTLCELKIRPASTASFGYQDLGTVALADSVLVFDMDNGQVSIAQYNGSQLNSSAIAVPAGPSGLGSVVHVQSQPPDQTRMVASPVFPTVCYSATQTNTFTVYAYIGTFSSPAPIPETFVCSPPPTTEITSTGATSTPTATVHRSLARPSMACVEANIAVSALVLTLWLSQF